MRVLLLGASGFIGSALAQALLDAGHEVVGVGRDPAYGRRRLPDLEWLQGDLRDLRSAADWGPFLAGADIVVNASGALQTGLRDDVEVVQRQAILALIEAAEGAGVRHFVQISAAGADRQGASAFLATKARADERLTASSLSHTILRPGLVIGRNGFGGTELLRAAAGFPLLAVEIGGTGPVQCVALSDVAEGVLRALADPARHGRTIDLVENEARPLHEVIALHRAWLGFPRAAARLRMPAAALAPVSLTADLLGWLGWRSPLRSNSIAALVDGVGGEAGQAARLLGREPLSLPQILAALGGAGKADRWHARLALLYPLALAVLVLLWLASGTIGLLRGDTARLLTDGGMAPGLARLCVIGGSLADLAVGAGIVFRPTMPLALKAGICLALAYLAGSLAVRPDLWLDPLAPMLKVLPVIVLSLACLAMSGER